MQFKRVLNFKVDSSEQAVEIVKALGELDADIVADSTPSSIKITIRGSKDKVREVSKKISALVKQSKCS